MTRRPLRDRARCLRRSQTEAERVLWARLRDRQLLGAKFRRQHPVGNLVVDFCCPEYRLVVELDGGQRATQVEKDQRRTISLAQHGYRVLRFWDNEVLKDTEAVLEIIVQALRDWGNNDAPECRVERTLM